MSGGLRPLGRREEIQDPLAFNPREVSPDRSVSVSGVRSPGQSGGAGNSANTEALQNALGGLQSAVGGIVDQAKDNAVTEGKVQFMQGKTLQDVQAAGNAYNEQGWQSLSAVDQANRWYTNETLNVQKTMYDKSPAEYSEYLSKSRAEALKNLPADPAVRKAYVAAFEEAGPRLAAAQIKANSEYQEKKTTDAFGSLLASTSTTAEGATRRGNGPVSTLRISDSVVDTPLKGSARDRDIGIRTMIGEAGGEGEIGLAAVGHVLKNRAGDKRWGGSIADVSLSPNQFSAWNSKGRGGVDIVRTLTPDSPAYQKAGLIYDAVMEGRTVDPTGGATHYYAPKGMGALVASGAAPNLVPAWARGEGAKNEVRIGNHVFSGKAGSNAVPAATARFGIPGIVPGTSSQPAPAASPAPATGVPNGTTIEVNPGADPKAVVEAMGVTTQQPKAQTQARELIMGFNGLKPEKKAVAVADAMRRQLATGDDSLFNDGGGVQTLRDLGASPNDIDEVIKAKKAFDKEQLGAYSTGYEKERAQLIQDAKSGKISEDEAITRVTNFRQRSLLNDADAKGLVRDVIAKVNDFKGEGQKINLDLQDGLANVYTAVRTKGMDPHTAGEYIKALALEHNVPTKELEGYISKAYAEDESRTKKLESEARAGVKKAQDEQETKDLVNASLSQGWGLKNVQGSVTVPDAATGNDITVSAQQYGVRVMSDKIRAQVADQVKNQSLDPSMAGPTYERIKFGALAKHDVVDDEFKAQITGALTGDIIDPKTKKPTDGAKAAFDMYLRIGNDPAVGPEYMAGYLSPEARSLVITAKTMYDGRLNIEDALLKAHKLINDPLADKDAKLARDGMFDMYAKTGIDKAINESTGSDSWLKYFSGSIKYNASEMKELRDNSGQMKNFVYARASAYHMQFPNQPPETSIKMAAQDAARNFIPVKGGMLYGDYEKGQRIDQAMGVEAYGKDKPMELIENYVKEVGPEFWKTLYTKRQAGYIMTGVNALKGITPLTSPPIGTEGYGSRFTDTAGPAYGVVYNPDTKTIGINLYDARDTKRIVGPTMWVRADALGQRFIEKDRVPGVAANIWDTVSRGIADTLYGNKKDALVKQGYTQAEIDDPEGFLAKKRNK